MSGTVEWHPGAPCISESFQWGATASPNGMPIFTAGGGGRIVGIVGRPETIETGAATVTVVASAPGVSIANGTAVAPAMNVGSTATALQPQVLTAWGVTEALTLAPGTTIGMKTTGTITASAASITVYWVAS